MPSNLEHGNSEVVKKRMSDTCRSYSPAATGAIILSSLMPSYALIAQEEAKEKFKREKLQAAIAAGTRKHKRRARPERWRKICCEDDGTRCYCKLCWDGHTCGCVSTILARVSGRLIS